MFRKSIAVISAVACLGFSGFAAAPEDSSCTKEGPRGERMAKELGLSVQQKAKLKELREEMKGIHKAHMEKMKSLLDKSKEELMKPVPSKDVLYANARQSGELRRVMAEKEADHLLKVKAVLTPEQFGKLLSRDFMLRGCPGPGGGPCKGKCPHEKGMREKCRHGGPEGNPPEGGPHDMDESTNQ
jgi:Spy/CpxP family protein refolding chaperone